MAAKLVMAVREIDKGVFPLLIRVNTFEVTPPGQNDSIITPTAISGGNENAVTKQNARTGRITNWLTAPVKNAFGY
jgi:hypothetical protein